MNLVREVNDFLGRYLETNDTVIVAVSGGRDSMCLLDIIQKTPFRFVVAHCNFKLRGNESDDDESFVKNYCNKKEIQFTSTSFDTQSYCEENKIGTQEGARILRYDWFRELLNNYEAKYVLTAHHANDNAETFLFNLVRGTNLNNITAIPQQTEIALRPLLNFTSEEINNYCLVNNITYRVDSSNETYKYSRNFIRKNILPLLENVNPRAIPHINQCIELIKKLEQLAQRHIYSLESKFVISSETTTVIKFDQLKSEPQYELFLTNFLVRFGFSNQVVQNILTTNQTGSYWLSNSHKLTLNRGELLISSKTEPSKLAFEIHSLKADEIKLGDFIVKIDLLDNAPSHFDNDKLYLDITSIHMPLIIRHLVKGDTFAPLGLQGKHKKISDYLINKKISLPDKQSCFVLEDRSKICAVVPYGISDLVKLNSSSTKTLVISLQKI